MDTEEFWRLWIVMSNYINNKDQSLAMEEYLNFLYENDACNIVDLKEFAENEEDDTAVKSIKRFIKLNDLMEEDEDY